MTTTGTEGRFQKMLMEVGALKIAGTSVYPAFPKVGNQFFVSPHLGNDNFDGSSWDTAFATFAACFTADNFVSGSTIYFNGKVKEQAATPAGVFDVTIIGTGNRPRHADEHTTNGGYSAATWTIPDSPTADTPLLRLNQQGWRLVNFLMQADTSQVCVDLFKNASSGDDERDAGHAEFVNMRFDNAGIGIRNNGGCGFVGIYDSLFRGMTTGIAHIVGSGQGTLSWWDIQRNRFESNTNHVVVPLDRGVVRQNMFMTFTTLGMDLSGGTVGKNMVTENTFMGDYSTATFVAGSDDFWFNNHSDDTGEAEVDADGKTNAVPAS